MKNFLSLVYLTLVCIVLGPGMTPAASAEEDLSSWYQIDVIVFTPRRADLDEESWPVSEVAYPANMVAIAQGAEVRPMRLSQLEQLGSTEPMPVEDEPVQLLDENTFVFESQSRGSRNRRLVESLLRQENSEETAPDEPEQQVDESLPEAIEEEPAAEPVDLDALFDAIDDARNFGATAFEPRVDQSSLTSIARSLNRSSRFDMLSHYSWVQPIDNTPTPVLIQTGARYDDAFEIDGTLSFSRSRYLHVQSDLWYTMFEQRHQNQNPFKQPIDSTLDDKTLAANRDLVEIERNRGQYVSARTHIMFQSRRMRSGELHYLDHPLFGVIVRVNRHTFETATGE